MFNILFIRDSAEQTEYRLPAHSSMFFPTIASAGLNGIKTEASSNVLSQTVTC